MHPECSPNGPDKNAINGETGYSFHILILQDIPSIIWFGHTYIGLLLAAS